LQAPAAPVARPAAASRPPAARPASPPPAADGTIEISIDEEVDLNELAKQVERGQR
jgi:hypothetical protein